MLNLPIKYAIVFALVFAFFIAKSQEVTTGKSLPDLQLNRVLNASGNQIKLSQFKGRLVVLDFWNFRCLTCLESFPHMDSLQKIFGDKIQIIFVNQETMEQTEGLFLKRKKLHRPQVPMVTSDSILNKLFPHLGCPYHVWIDKDGKVLYLTESFFATEKNISAVLKGENIGLPKRIYRTSVAPLTDRVKSITPYYSIITRYDPSVELTSPFEDHSSLVYETMTPLGLYQTVMDSLTHNEFEFSRVGRTILDISDPENFTRPSDPELIEKWYLGHVYNYQLAWPKNRNGERFKIMKDDLDRYFDFDVSIEKRIIKCLALVRLSNEDRLKTKGGVPKFNLSQTDLRTSYESPRYIKNLPFFRFFERLRYYAETKYQVPVVDQTGYEGNIDFEISPDLLDSMDLPELRKVLNKYALDLYPVNCQLTVLVVRHK